MSIAIIGTTNKWFNSDFSLLAVDPDALVGTWDDCEHKNSLHNEISSGDRYRKMPEWRIFTSTIFGGDSRIAIIMIITVNRKKNKAKHGSTFL